MHERVGNFSWHATSLGEIESWPHELRTAVGICLETGQATCIFWTRDCVHLYNDKYTSILARRSVDALGKRLLDVWPTHRKQLQELIDQVFSGNAVHRTNQSWFDNPGLDSSGFDDTGHAVTGIAGKGGRRKESFTISTIPIRDADGRVVGMYQTVEETTDAKEVQHRLRQAEAALLKNERLAVVGRLASSIAHEINNPLESITNLLYLARNCKTLQVALGYLEIAEREVRRIAEITKQTLRFHRQSNFPHEVTCGSLLEPMIVLFRSTAARSGIEIEMRDRARNPFLCFEGEITQILINLIGNAIDSMQATGGKLLLRAREGTEWRSGRRGVIFTVADGGTGIPPEIAARVFDPFFTTKGNAGSGIGLWISMQKAAQHKGQLRMRSSVRQGRAGTVFTLFIPFDATIR